MTEAETIRKIGDKLSEAWKLIFAYSVHSNPTYLGRCRCICLDIADLLEEMLRL